MQLKTLFSVTGVLWLVFAKKLMDGVNHAGNVPPPLRNETFS